tara:strand:+ start:1612 stop:1884 length:273 start_codon:yes stop_codon:yes gene_type:complete
MDKVTPETSARAAVDAIADGNRAAAVDAINNLMYGKSAETLDQYSDVLAKSYFGDMELPDVANDTPEAEAPEAPEANSEPKTDETDNGNN